MIKENDESLGREKLADKSLIEVSLYEKTSFFFIS